MYAREINGEEHTLGVSGKLIMNALVMYDHQTMTLWSQFLGQGVKGLQKGVKLDIVPVTHTRWSAWREIHPQTLVLDKRGRYRSDSYASYYLDCSAGVLGVARPDERLDHKAMVVGVQVNGRAKAYPFQVLLDRPIVNDSVATEDILVFLERGTDTALVHDRTVEGRTLTFGPSPEGTGARALLVDVETGTRWLALTGLAVAGPLKGKVLERAPSHLSFWFAWNDWHPDTQLYEAPASPPAGR